MDYDFHACVRTNIAKSVGCRPPWDSLSPKFLNVCQNLSQFDKIESYEYLIMWNDQNKVINVTGCLIPCQYKEFQVIGEPRKASGSIYGYPMKKG